MTIEIKSWDGRGTNFGEHFVVKLHQGNEIGWPKKVEFRVSGNHAMSQRREGYLEKDDAFIVVIDTEKDASGRPGRVSFTASDDMMRELFRAYQMAREAILETIPDAQ